MKTTEDSRLEDFAEVLVDQATEIEKGDNVYLLAKSIQCLPLYREVRRKVIQRGGRPHEHILYDSQLSAEGLDHDWIKYADEEQLESISEAKKQEMEKMDAYIRIGGDDNSRELSGISSEKISLWKSTTREILNERLSKKWVATRFPTDSMAQKAGMPTEEFEEMVFNSVNTDYEKLKTKNKKVKKVIDSADTIRIKDENTDLTLSIKDREGVSSHGKRNIPDGEVFYAPVKESLEGKIEFTYPGVSSGNEVSGIKLWFENGKIVDFEASENEDFLKKMIKTDEGSEYIGELGIGTNREITEYTKDTLFDEKMGGTIHLAIGRAYEECAPEDKRNKSSVHWDIVKDLRPREGGGKIIADGEVIQEDGEWKIDV